MTRTCPESHATLDHGFILVCGHCERVYRPLAQVEIRPEPRWKTQASEVIEA